ncbi:unnamed protein product [Chironomus riparius]|uniref:NACHT domain-containing protein n=1 Tax=Chironomus riparius TaxID=315576 RepID=A0A9P0JGL2_9DIPT|nr:unnamed protein product [Chironomus riparius]
MNSTVVYKNVDVRFKDLFADGSVAYEKLTSDHISQFLEGMKLDFEDPYLHYLDELVIHDWGNLTDKLRDKFLTSNFTFQNESVRFMDLHGHAVSSFKVLSSQNIVDVLDGKQLLVNKMIENRTEFYVERIFWNEDILDIYGLYTKGNFKVSDWEKEEKFREFYDQFVGQNFSDYIQKIGESKRFAQLRLFFVSRSDNSFDVLLNFSSFHDNFETILKSSESKKIFILSSEAGTGKTINFEQFAMRIKRKYPTKWVSYIDLKDYTKLYSENDTVKDVEALLFNILDLTSKSLFEQSIFHELYNSGSVVLLWNGFDEISPAYNKFILDTFVAIQNSTSNVQFICTRPLYSQQLVEAMKVLPYTLVSFSKDQQEEFLRKFFMSRNIEDIHIHSYINKTLKIVKSLKAKTSIAKTTEDFNTPLMLEMIADLISDNADIFESENLYEIYRKFVKKKIEIWRKKSEFAYKFLGDSVTEYRKFDMLEMYQMFALKSELRSISPFTHLTAGKLKIMRQKVPKELTSVEISRMGILYINGQNEFKFSHKTFAEFFVAQFFIENIYNAEVVDGEDALVLFHNFEYVTEYYGLDQLMTTNFMISYLQTQDGVASDGFEPKIVEIFKKKFKRIFFNILRDKRVDTFKFLFEFFKKDHKLLVELLEVDEAETLYTAAYNCAYFPDQIDSFDRKIIKDLGRKYLSKDEYERFVTGRDQKGVILYGLYVFNRQDVGKTGARRVFHDEYDLDEKILKNEDKIVVFKKIVKLLTKSEVKELLTSISSPINYKEFDLIVHPKFWNISQKFLSEQDQKQQISSIFYGLSRHNDPAPYLPSLISKTVNILTPSEVHKLFKSKNILHRSVHNFEPFWNFFVNQTTADQQTDMLNLEIDGECFYYYLYSPNQNCYFYPPFNIFHVTLISQYPSSYDSLQAFEFIRQIYEKYFDKSEMQDMILDSNDFMPYMIRLTPFESCERFVEFLRDLFKGSEGKLKEFLLRRINPTSFNIFEYLDNIGVENISKNVKLLSDMLDYIDKL